MIKTYGQMPKQLFDTPHPKSSTSNNTSFEKSVLHTVKGLKWGIYTGSPNLAKPKMIIELPQQNHVKIHNLVAIAEKNVCYGLNSKYCLMQGNRLNNLDVVLWGEPDNLIRIKSLAEDAGK